MTIDAKPVARAALASGALLLIPLVAMLVADDVAWSPFDFAFMGALLFGTGLAFQLFAQRATALEHRLAPPGAWGVLALNAGFAAAFAVSGLLFLRSSAPAPGQA